MQILRGVNMVKSVIIMPSFIEPKLHFLYFLYLHFSQTTRVSNTFREVHCTASKCHRSLIDSLYHVIQKTPFFMSATHREYQLEQKRHACEKIKYSALISYLSHKFKT